MKKLIIPIVFILIGAAMYVTAIVLIARKDFPLWEYTGSESYSEGCYANADVNTQPKKYSRKCLVTEAGSRMTTYGENLNKLKFGGIILLSFGILGTVGGVFMLILKRTRYPSCK